MSATTTTYRDALDRVVAEVVAPQAGEIDKRGAFPRAGVTALGEAGLLALVSATEVGGGGQGLRAAADTVERVARACGSTAMVLLMHYSAVALVEHAAPRDVRRAIAREGELLTLAFSEAGSRSHFWVPLSTATRTDGAVRLDARKSWVTSAGEADRYVWSSRPLAADGPMTVWLVPGERPGLSWGPPFDGLGLRGNASTPMIADGVEVPEAVMLGPDGGGLDLALGVMLPWFLVLNAVASVGMMEALTAETAAHLGRTRLEHLDRTLAQQPGVRAELADMRLTTDTSRALLEDTIGALEAGRDDAQLRVLEVKAGCGEAVMAVADRAMRLCGGAAFRRELGVERRFRDATAARVMAPTTPALRDFIGRAVTGLPLLDPVA